MLITPDGPDSRSAGSFFKNPVLTPAQFQELEQKAGEHNLKIPSYPAPSQQKKVSAAWMVENSGFVKGYIKGHAGISSKHALALVNRGDARPRKSWRCGMKFNSVWNRSGVSGSSRNRCWSGFEPKGGSATESDELSLDDEDPTMREPPIY